MDDDDKSDVDDEEMEAVNAELAGDAARQGAAADQEKEKAPTVKKGVRIQGSTGRVVLWAFMQPSAAAQHSTA